MGSDKWQKQWILDDGGELVDVSDVVLMQARLQFVCDHGMV